MKKKKIAMMTTAFVAAMNMNGCGVYGPPTSEQTLNNQIQNEVIQNDEMEVTNSAQADSEIHGEVHNG